MRTPSYDSKTHSLCNMCSEISAMQSLSGNLRNGIIVLQSLYCSHCVAIGVLQLVSWNHWLAIRVSRSLRCSRCFGVVVLQSMTCNHCFAIVVIQPLSCNHRQTQLPEACRARRNVRKAIRGMFLSKSRQVWQV